MANDSYYREKNFNCGWAPETSLRTNAHGKDAANVIGDTFYELMGRVKDMKLYYKKANRLYERVANSGLIGYIAEHGTMEGKITISSNMIDLSMLKQLTKACTNSDAEGVYTHTYALTTAQGDPPASFWMWFKFTNTEAGNSIYINLYGCVLQKVHVGGHVVGHGPAPIEMTYEINFAAAGIGLALTTEPSFGTLKNYLMSSTSITLTKGGAAYPGKAMGFSIDYNDNTYLHKARNEVNPEEALNGNPEIKLHVDYLPKNETLFEDTIKTPLAPATGSDIDVTIKMYRHATDDYTEFAFEKLWNIEGDFAYLFSYMNTALAEMSLDYIIKPVGYEAGALLTITEKNAKLATRYT